jgi:hypothetical protein
MDEKAMTGENERRDVVTGRRLASGEAKTCQGGRCAPCVPPGPASPICTPGATPCCVGACIQAQPEVFLCTVV